MRNSRIFVSRYIIGLALVLLSFCPGRANAFYILSAFTDPCHEQLTLSTLECVDGGVFGPSSVACIGPLFPSAALHPIDPVATAVADVFADAMGLTVENDQDRLVLISLAAGVRFPDIRGGSAYHLSAMRPLVLSDEYAHLHFIRRSYDDGPQGDQDAAAVAHEFIRSELYAAIDLAKGPVDDRYQVHSIAIDFYGKIDVVLYEPLFRMGVALHTFQDSFSHTLRSDDLVSIVSVLNAVEAITGTLDEEQDGIAHSMAMDRCMDEAFPVAQVVAVATSDLIEAVSLQAAGAVDGPVDQVLDAWLTVQDGCTLENHYCDSVWLDLARQDPFKPVIPLILGCNASSSSSAGSQVFLIMLLLLSPFVFMRFWRNQ